MNHQSPELWQVPDWHRDWVSAREEFEQLRHLAIGIVEKIPGAAVRLENPEEGLLFVQLTMPEGVAFEIYSVEPEVTGNRRRFSVFPDVDTPQESEKYFASVVEVMEFLAGTC
ncbi:MAG: hypothetical protein U0903_05475 [Planctomycetales bacterium]